MSKTSSSPQGIVELLDDPKVVAKRIRSAVTDTGRDIRFDPVEKPGISNLLTIHSALSGRSIAQLEADYDGEGYGRLKVDVADVVVAALRPFVERFDGYMGDPDALDEVLADGAERARSIAGGTLERVYDAVGLVRPRRGRG
jgi:tryptophanyl-tRNA synthetase